MTLIYLIISLIIVTLTILYLVNMKNKGLLAKHFIMFMLLLTLPLISLSFQIILKNTNIPPIYFDYITYIFTFFAPLELLFIALLFNKPTIDLNRFKSLYLLPITAIITLWTNDIHHGVYVVYSIEFSKTVFGPLFYLVSGYGYLLLIIDMIIMCRATIRKSGFFSKQTLLILLGILIPLLGNLLGVLGIVESNIYVTPILFSITAILFALAIFKFKALNITPVAFKTVINTMSDAYVVISDDGTIVDTNKTFEAKFSEIFQIDNNQNLFDTIEKYKILDLDELKKNILLTRKKGDIVTNEYNIIKDDFNKFFEVDIHPIKAKSSKNTEYVGTLLLFKDITQHKNDIKIIQEKQDIIVKQQQLVSIGELAGGVAHDINTPISAIKTGIMMLNEMGTTRTESEKEILTRMDNCATKIINIVNSMRNQIRNLGSDNNVSFKISNVINDVKIITYHELAKNKTDVEVNIVDDVSIYGDSTKLGQVLTNLVVNASQQYKEKGGKIEVTVKKDNSNNAVIMVKDYAGGIDESVRPYIFKNILTTKGIGGTGLGLYLAYSVIKGNFNGEMYFECEDGVGTTFYISIPIK